MAKLNILTVEILLATFADEIQGATRTDSDYLSRRLKEVKDFLRNHHDMIILLDAAIEEDNKDVET